MLNFDHNMLCIKIPHAQSDHNHSHSPSGVVQDHDLLMIEGWPIDFGQEDWFMSQE